MVSHLSFGQSVEVDTISSVRPSFSGQKRFTVGLDVFKNVPFLVFNNDLPLPSSQSARLHNRGIVEVVLGGEISDNFYWNGLAGFIKAEVTDLESIARRQEVVGWYGKGGVEWALGQRKRHSKLGIRGMLTYTGYATDLLYKGPSFGDYQTRDVVNNFGVGFEPYYAYDFFLGPRWLLRWETRWSHHLRVVGKGETPYYPGVGVSFGLYDYVVSGGNTLQLHYRFRP